jgi:transposase
MWTVRNRRRHDRSPWRYPSDLTDDEWAHFAPLIPPAKAGGNKRSVDVREVMNGLMYVPSTRCQWRAIPKDLPPRSAFFDYLDLWNCDGALDWIHHALYVECREQGEHEASPTAAIIDRQSVRKLLLHAIVHPANIQDRLLLASLFGTYPFLKKLFADAAYQGPAFLMPWRKPCHISKLKSSSAPIRPMGLLCCQSAGPSSHGSIAAAGLPRIGRISIGRRLYSCASLQFA